jgi:hypothetical protein
MLAAFSAWMWSRTRQNKFAVGALIALLLMAGVIVLAQTVPTDRKKIERAIQEMSLGVKGGDMNRIFAQFSEDFHFQSYNKADFRMRCELVARPPNVEEVVVWDAEPPEISRDKKTAKMTFKAKPKGRWSGDAAFYLVKSEFVKEPDGQWRMRTFEVFNPFVDTRHPLQIPGF